jgi:hypothetical protein
MMQMPPPEVLLLLARQLQGTGSLAGVGRSHHVDVELLQRRYRPLMHPTRKRRYRQKQRLSENPYKIRVFIYSAGD